MPSGKFLVLILVAVMLILPAAILASPAWSATLKIGEPSQSKLAGSYLTSSSSVPTGVIVPLYTYPTSPTWNDVIQAKLAYPDVPIVAVINPYDGPGGSFDQNYANGINSLRSAGVIVLGYVYTSYGARSLSSDESDVRLYNSWYNVSGIFFDEMSSSQGYESYYSTLNSYVKSLGYTMTVGNPGEQVPSSLIGTLDVLCIYENQGLPSTSMFASLTAGGTKQSFGAVSYNVGSLSTSFESSASNYVAWIYITTGNQPDPYNSLPSYFTSEVAALNPFVPQLKVQNASLSILSYNSSGGEIEGQWVSIKSDNGTVLALGLTPLNYTSKIGSTLAITASSSQQYQFDHWGNESNQLTTYVNLTQLTVIRAYYGTARAVPSSISQPMPIDIPQLPNSASLNGAWGNQTSSVASSYSSQNAQVTAAPGGAQMIGLTLLLGWVICFIFFKKTRAGDAIANQKNIQAEAIPGQNSRGIRTQSGVKSDLLAYNGKISHKNNCNSTRHRVRSRRNLLMYSNYIWF